MAAWGFLQFVPVFWIQTSLVKFCCMWSRKQKQRHSAVSSQWRRSSPVLSFITSYHPPLRPAQGIRRLHRPRRSARHKTAWNLRKSTLHQIVMVRIWNFFFVVFPSFPGPSSITSSQRSHWWTLPSCNVVNVMKWRLMFSFFIWDLCAAILLACLFCHPLDCLWASVRGCGHCCWSLCSSLCCCDPGSLPSVPDINRLCDLCSCLGLRCCLCDCPMCDICLQATECLDLAMEISQMLFHWRCQGLKKKKYSNANNQ